MSDPFDRRHFDKLALAALGGLLAGATGGCGPANDPAGPAAAAELHICRGMNKCKGQGKGGENACAGQGACATVKDHSCAGENECKGQGGCGNEPGFNECKGKGGCHVPLSGAMWDGARKVFEDKMKAANKPVGVAPPEKMG